MFSLFLNLSYLIIIDSRLVSIYKARGNSKIVVFLEFVFPTSFDTHSGSELPYSEDLLPLISH